MLKYTIWLLLAFSPIFLNSQNAVSGEDTASRQSIQDECDKIFTKSEQIPSLKISKAQFEDTLTSLLKAKKAFHKTDKIRFSFILSRQSHITDLNLESGEIKKEDKVKESIQSLSDLWLPAIQNGRAVCSYVRLEMTIQKDTLNVNIFQ